MTALYLVMRKKLTTSMDPDRQSKDPCLAGVLDKGTFIVIMQILSLLREESGLEKRIKLLWSAIY